jgi:diadenylate cyclase
MSQYINTVISSIGFTDIVDIAIISYIVYKLLGFIKSTRAAQLARGVAIVLVAFFASEFFHLYALHWLLEKLISVGLVALVVVFQPELRRGLEYLGRGKLGLSRFTEDKQSGSVSAADEMTKAIAHFASISEGALIVIERGTALNDIAETGTIIDAKISEQLLENIFYVGSPLHDGAVIIRGERVYSAGCMLPLTENPNLSKDLGTRHRAGIGITEISDALVFIVSEETGIISMCEDGKISRFIDIKTVEKTLLAHYMKQSAANSRLGLPGIFTSGKEADNEQ